ncbi:HAD family hydrolase [Bdellovibrio sp. HCB337]|uniref:HAD family hydrolase n=1 Tax=Bdellovibrio sp. HCB337 TaxID=3394358 RepID=UPI0039A57993
MKKLLSTLVFFVSTIGWGASDPLPSWNDGDNKQAILKFVAEVTQEKGERFVKPEDRIATFDNDGTLWSEVPTVEVEFTKERLHEILKKDAKLRSQEPYKSLLAKGKAALPALSQKQILNIMAKTHSGMSEEEFEKEVRQFFALAKHPKLNVPYTQTTYKPMLELVAYLRSKDFKIFISSGGDIAFMRAVTNDIYGVPPQNVIGSFFVDHTIERDGRLQVMRTSTLGLINDKDNKPVGIVRHIGKRPIFAAGNVRSSGDIQHLRYSSEGSGPSLQLMINHDDADREAAYQEKGDPSLNAAKKFSWKIISIKNDWRQVFTAPQPLAKTY